MPSPIDINSLTISGGNGWADIAPAVTGGSSAITMTEAMEQASTVEITVTDKFYANDGKRSLLQQPMLSTKSKLTLDGADFELCQVSKSGSQLTLTFENTAVAKLRTYTTPRKVPPNTMSRVDFCKMLISEEPSVLVNSAPGDGMSLVELARGTFDSTLSNQEVADDPENTWDAVARIMGEIGWRVFARRNEIVIAPDSWLTEQTTPLVIQEDVNGVNDIDFDWDIGKPAATASFTCEVSPSGGQAAGTPLFEIGSTVSLPDMGPAAAGSWLVNEVVRSPFTFITTVNLLRQKPELAEPGA